MAIRDCFFLFYISGYVIFWLICFSRESICDRLFQKLTRNIFLWTEIGVYVLVCESVVRRSTEWWTSFFVLLVLSRFFVHLQVAGPVGRSVSLSFNLSIVTDWCHCPILTEVYLSWSCVQSWVSHLSVVKWVRSDFRLCLMRSVCQFVGAVRQCSASV